MARCFTSILWDWEVRYLWTEAGVPFSQVQFGCQGSVRSPMQHQEPNQLLGSDYAIVMVGKARERVGCIMLGSSKELQGEEPCVLCCNAWCSHL